MRLKDGSPHRFLPVTTTSAMQEILCVIIRLGQVGKMKPKAPPNTQTWQAQEIVQGGVLNLQEGWLAFGDRAKVTLLMTGKN